MVFCQQRRFKAVVLFPDVFHFRSHLCNGMNCVIVAHLRLHSCQIRCSDESQQGCAAAVVQWAAIASLMLALDWDVTGKCSVRRWKSRARLNFSHCRRLARGLLRPLHQNVDLPQHNSDQQHIIRVHALAVLIFLVHHRHPRLLWFVITLATNSLFLGSSPYSAVHTIIIWRLKGKIFPRCSGSRLEQLPVSMRP